MSNDPLKQQPNDGPSEPSLWNRLKSNDNKPKKYFDALADKYLKASHILYIALAVCFLFTLIFNSKLLTYNNFTYLIKDLLPQTSLYLNLTTMKRRKKMKIKKVGEQNGILWNRTYRRRP